MTIKLFSLLVLMPLLLNSCGERRSISRNGILSEKKMAELLVETHLMDAILNLDISSAVAKRDKALFYYPSILEKYHITKAQMDSSVTWYMRNPEAFTRIYEQVIKDLEKRKTDDMAKGKPE